MGHLLLTASPKNDAGSPPALVYVPETPYVNSLCFRGDCSILSFQEDKQNPLHTFGYTHGLFYIGKNENVVNKI